MLSLSLFIQGTLWMLRLLFSIVINVISVSKVTSLEDWSLRVFSKCHCHCHCHCHCLFWSGHVSSSLWSNVSKVTSLWGRSLFLKSKSTVSESLTRSPIHLFWTAKNNVYFLKELELLEFTERLHISFISDCLPFHSGWKGCQLWSSFD